MKNQNNILQATKSWKNINTHYLEVLKDPWYRLICDLENLISKYTYQFYFGKDMKTIHLPITTSTISSPMGLGSDSSPVKINLFNIPTYLADSMQFMLEYGCRLYKQGCFYIMPSFRGELADERHLCQFYHSEAEIVGTMEDAINLVEEYVKYLTNGILEEYGSELKKNRGSLSHLYKLKEMKEIPRVRFEEAVEILNKDYEGKGYEKYELFTNINKIGEQYLIEHFGEIVWITNFEHMALPFYQAYEDERYAKNADLLFGIGEVVGLGERHFGYQDVQKSLKQHQVSPEEYEWYCKMKQLYPLKTSGYGLGIERYLLWVLNHNDIRDCQLLPRFNGENIIP